MRRRHSGLSIAFCNSCPLDLRPGAPKSGVGSLFFRDLECGLPPQMGYSNVVAI